MKTKQKLLIICLPLLMAMLSSCATIHETTSSQPKMTLKEAMASLKEAIMATKQDPMQAQNKAVKDVIVSKDGLALVNADSTKRYFVFNDMVDPKVTHDPILNHYFIQFKNNLTDLIVFNTSQSAIMFADALYYLKHTDITQEREKEQQDSLRRVQQTAADEQKEREKKQEESLRLMRKTAIEGEAGAARDEGITESGTQRRKSQPRPAPPKKAAVEPPQRQPEGGAPSLPALPPGGAVSGN